MQPVIGQVAKYFGPTGTVVQTLDDGWLITGCILKKDDVDQLVDKKNQNGGVNEKH